MICIEMCWPTVFSVGFFVAPIMVLVVRFGGVR